MIQMHCTMYASWYNTTYDSLWFCLHYDTAWSQTSCSYCRGCPGGKTRCQFGASPHTRCHPHPCLSPLHMQCPSTLCNPNIFCSAATMKSHFEVSQCCLAGNKSEVSMTRLLSLKPLFDQTLYNVRLWGQCYVSLMIHYIPSALLHATVLNIHKHFF